MILRYERTSPLMIPSENSAWIRFARQLFVYKLVYELYTCLMRAHENANHESSVLYEYICENEIVKRTPT